MPKELGNLVKLAHLPLHDNEFQGELYVPAYMCCVFAEIHSRVAGELPKELGDLVNLTELWLNHNQFRGELYVPVYMR